MIISKIDKVTHLQNNIHTVDEWKEYAPPKKNDSHWVSGRSAKELAELWVGSGSVIIPQQLINILQSEPRFKNINLIAGYPEHKIKFDDLAGETRNADLAIEACCGDEPVAITIEAKADEPLDNYLDKKMLKALEEKIKNPNSQAVKRIADLVQAILPLRTKQIPALAKIRYQLLTGIAGTIAFANELNAKSAVFIIHEFHTSSTNPDKIKKNSIDIDKFIERFTSGAETKMLPGKLYGPYKIPGQPLFQTLPELYLGRIII
jgi:hypothetical protein